MNRGSAAPWGLRAGLALCAALGLATLGPLAGASAAEAVGVARIPAAAAPGAKVRTPARIEVLAGRDVAGSQGTLVAVEEPTRWSAMVADGKLGGWLGVVAEGASLDESVRSVALGYSVSPLAILRTDTDIHDWRALSGRTVCLAADGRYVGELAARYGAIEQIYPSTTDALLGVRTGLCDAMVHDQAFLEALLAFPEWKKFSARLEPYRKVDLMRVTAAARPGAVRGLLEATSPRHLAALTAGQARDIAFEVYLDQVVPDCH
ncbi:ABC transporter substrate-binding protein [Castellaniella sp. GW247-6E4]|uniref:ABC transporter substrate-binding protein n=1 Tax=Castellaniella sp. GW247-6E4 TaxID=3140380 RepID=UPI003315C9E5